MNSRSRTHPRPTANLLRTAVTTVIAVTGITVAVVIGIVFMVSSGDVLACSVVPRPLVHVDELPTVLDPDGAWADDYNRQGNPPVPTVTGAYRSEVINTTPESDEFFAGAVWRQTNVWGEAAVTAVDVRGPIRKSEGTTCDGNQSALGTVIYYLSTEDGVPIQILGTDVEPDGTTADSNGTANSTTNSTNNSPNNSKVDAALDELFGPSRVATFAGEISDSADSDVLDSDTSSAITIAPGVDLRQRDSGGSSSGPEPRRVAFIIRRIAIFLAFGTFAGIRIWRGTQR